MARGVTKGSKREINKEYGRKQDLISARQDPKAFSRVHVKHRKSLEHIINEFRSIFSEKLSKGAPSSRGTTSN